MALKQKSRGSLLMVSEFLSELAGRLRCSAPEARAFATSHPNSIIATKVAKGEAENGVEARLIFEPGAGPGKDTYFDNEQLIEQTRLAMEVFDAMGRHIAPACEVRVSMVGLSMGVTADGHVHIKLSTPTAFTKQLPEVRCQALFLFDNSSGHGAGATDSCNMAHVNKGPDWNGKLPQMRDGFFFERREGCYFREWPDGTRSRRPSSFRVRVPHRMQFAAGDILPCDLSVPAGIDVTAPVGAAATAAPQVLPEQLLGRSIAKELGGLQYAGKITEVEENPPGAPRLVAVMEDEEVSEYELTVAEALDCLVGPPPEPAQHQEAPPTPAESRAAITLYFNGRRQTLKKSHPQADGPALRTVAEQEWPSLAAERQLHFVRKVRAAADGGTTQAAPTILKRGTCVPPRLVGRHKGSEVLLAERSLLPPGSLRASCASEADHAADNRCCCKRWLGSQPDFRSERCALECVVQAGELELVGPNGRVTVARHRCLFLPKYHCELNWIERYWGSSKKYARRHCGYSLTALRTCVPIVLSQTLDEVPAELRESPDLPVCPLFKQRRHARISWQYLHEYAEGESGDAVLKAVSEKRSKRHHNTSDARARQVEARMEALAFA